MAWHRYLQPATVAILVRMPVDSNIVQQLELIVGREGKH